MKTKDLIYTSVALVLLFVLTMQFGCKKDEPEPDPVKKKYVWAVGFPDSTNYGMIYFSGDGGENWIRQGEDQEALQNAYIHDVWAVDENTVWAVGVNNLILKTTDGGINWNRVTPSKYRSGEDLSSISIIGKDDIWISGTIVYHSPDGENTWITIQSDVLTDKYMQGIHAINSEIIYVVGAPLNTTYGFIARTIDGGKTWDSIVPTNNFNKNEWIGVTSSDPDNILIYGGTSHYMFSNDGGQSWRNDTTGISGGNSVGGPDINNLTMVDKQTWWGAMDNDNIGLTTNSGNSPWVNQGPAPRPLDMFLVGIDNYDKDLCVIVGETASYPPAGKIIQTSNGGKVWELKVNTGAAMKKVSFIK